MELETPTLSPASRPAPEMSAPTSEPSGFHRVLVPLDGSTLAEAVLPYVRRIARPGLTTIAVLRAVPPTPAAAMEMPTPAIFEADERAREEAQRYVDALASRLRAEGFAAEPQAGIADPATAIVDTARALHVDLIAMTTHGRTGISRLVFGSVAEQVLRRAPVPIFLVRVTDTEVADQAV